MKRFKIIEGVGANFEIVEDTGETAEDYAIWMVESMERKSYFERQERAFREQAQNERKKASDRNTILFQLKEYNKQKKRDQEAGITRFVSRMEPMETYDPEILEFEKKQGQERANEFHKTADNFVKLAKEEELKIQKYKRELAALNEVARDRKK